MRNNLMTSPTSQATVPPVEESEADELKAVDSTTEKENSELHDSPTPDAYDANIVPAETAARKEREGGSFKHLPEHPPGSESLDTTAGFTVDKEGLVDNFGIEPEMYYETPGDVKKKEDSDPELLDR
jgi:hypothetical protein